MSNKSLDSSRKSQLWGLILSYIESTQEVFDASNKLSLSEEKLIGKGNDPGTFYHNGRHLWPSIKKTYIKFS